MAQKNATPTKDQKRSIRNAGLNPVFWVVIRVLDHRLIILHRLTGKVQVIDK